MGSDTIIEFEYRVDPIYFPSMSNEHTEQLSNGQH